VAFPRSAGSRRERRRRTRSRGIHCARISVPHSTPTTHVTRGGGRGPRGSSRGRRIVRQTGCP
jgi:hypothetical protein